MTGNSVRILIVDDDQQVGRQLRELLADFDHDVVGLASDGSQALVLIKALRPEVVVTDLRMPGVSGIMLTTLIGQLAAPPAVVVVSAYGDASLQKQARAAGAHGYVVKGASGADVHHAVLAAAAHRRAASGP